MQDGRDAGWETNLRWLRWFLLLHVGCRTTMALHNQMVELPAWQIATYWLLLPVCATGLVPRLARQAALGAAALLAVQIAATMPVTANHVFLECLCLGLLALLNEAQPEERLLAMLAFRWLVVIMLFYSGLQKLIYGYYFDGQFLAYATATEDRFAAFFRHLMPEAEFLRLRGLAGADLGMGPYRADAAGFVIASNGAYAIELLLPVLLVIRRTRACAAIGAIAVVVAIEVAARELLFGTLAINLLLLFLPGTWVKKSLPYCATGYAYLVLSQFDLLPMFRFYR